VSITLVLFLVHFTGERGSETGERERAQILNNIELHNIVGFKNDFASGSDIILVSLHGPAGRGKGTKERSERLTYRVYSTCDLHFGCFWSKLCGR